MFLFTLTGSHFIVQVCWICLSPKIIEVKILLFLANNNSALLNHEKTIYVSFYFNWFSFYCPSLLDLSVAQNNRSENTFVSGALHLSS